MNVSSKSALLLFWLGLTLSSNVFATTLAATGRQGSNPDDSSFDIPNLPVPSDGFGQALEDACDVLVSAVAPSGGVNSTVSEDVALQSVSSAMRKAPDAENLALATVKLAEICKVLASGDSVDEAQLDLLRSFEDSGVFSNLVTALNEQKGNPTLDRGKLAHDMRAAAGTLRGSGEMLPVTGIESTVLNGLADLVVTRSKEEAILYLQGEIADEFCKDDGLKALPSTCSTITGLDPSLSIAAIGNALNVSAKRDLGALPDGILRVIADKDPNHLYLYEPLRVVYAVATAAHQGRSPIELVRSLYAIEPRKCETTNAPTAVDKQTKQVFDTVRVASALVYSAQASKVDQLGDKLAAHPALTVGILLEMESRYSTPFGGQRIAILKPEMIHDLAGILNGLVGVIIEWQQHQRALVNAADGKLTLADRRRALATTLFDSLVRVNALQRSLAPILVTDPSARETVVQSAAIARALAQVGRDLASEDYGAIPTDTSALIGDLSAKLKLSKGLTTTLRRSLKYAPVMAELASARSSADVSTALQAAAAPASSYRCKYQRDQVAIAGLVGALVGKEVPNEPSNTFLGKAESSGAVAGFAPIGLEATIPVGGMFYTGLMASVLDLGALTTARFKSQASTGNNVTTTTNVTFGQVFSPGGYVVLGLFGSPIVVGGGVSYAPNLRRLQTTDQNDNVTVTENVSTVRVGAFLAAEVTLLPL